MGNIISYLKWRGDLSLTERHFNEVDNLVLAALSYLDLEGIVPSYGENKSISVKEAAALLVAKQTEIDIERSKRLGIVDNELLIEMSRTERFKNAKLSNFIDLLDHSKTMQFSALLIELDDSTHYISYRGTDNSILGWREDFTLSFKAVSAQQLALEYLESVIGNSEKLFRVGGHSKGGNLAMYAAMMCSDDKRNQIINIYNNDGPGFSNDLTWSSEFKKIQNKTIRIIPEFSVIGMLFTPQDSSYYIVASSAEGFMQHHPLSWEIEGSSFIRKEVLANRCLQINNMIDTWIRDVDIEHRESFTKDFFDALEASGANLIMDVAGIDRIESILMALHKSDTKTKSAISKLFRTCIHSIRNIDFYELIKTIAIIKGVSLTLIGLFFMQVPNTSYRILGTLLMVSILSFSGYKIIQSIKKKQAKSPLGKIIFCIYALFALLSFVFLVKGTAFTVSTNILLSIGFFVNAYLNFILYLKSEYVQNKIWFAIPNIVISALFGIVSWINISDMDSWYIFFSGGYLIIAGMIETITAVYKITHKKHQTWRHH